MSTKLVVIGGVAGGATAAARARRLAEDAEIVVIERNDYVSFANCGLPYHIGGEISQRASLLVQTPAALKQRHNLDVRTRHEATSIDRERKVVTIRRLDDDTTYEEDYDFLLLAPGAAPLCPPIPGVDHPRVMSLRNLEDLDRIKAAVDSQVRAALVVGGGFIGLEMAENLRRRGLEVTLVELLPQVLPPLDPELAAPLHDELSASGVALYLGDGVTALADDAGRVRATLKSGKELAVDLVVLSVGVRPDTQLARDAELQLNERGAIVVDEHMRTSDPAIYAVGDAIEVRDVVRNVPTMIPLAGPANRQGRIAADSIFGRASRYRGSQGTSVVRVFGLTAASTGASEKLLQKDGRAYKKVYATPLHHVGYFPGAQQMLIKLLFAPEDGRILGAQIVGADGVDKRIDVLALALQAGQTVFDLEEAELAYAPQYGAAKDPVNIIGFIAANVLRGDIEFAYAEDLHAAALRDWNVLDVREPAEYAAGHIAGSVSIPLGQLRQRLDEVPRDKPLVVHCYSGQRSYYACRILRQNGIACKNLAGGIRLYELVHAAGDDAPLTASRCSGTC